MISHQISQEASRAALQSTDNSWHSHRERWHLICDDLGTDGATPQKPAEREKSPNRRNQDRSDGEVSSVSLNWMDKDEDDKDTLLRLTRMRDDDNASAPSSKKQKTFP